MALLAALVSFAHLFAGLTNRQLVGLVATLLDTDYTIKQATYDLRRLRRKGIITRLPGTFRYQLTPTGRAVAVLFTKAYGRVPTPGLAACDLALPDATRLDARVVSVPFFQSCGSGSAAPRPQTGA